MAGAALITVRANGGRVPTIWNVVAETYRPNLIMKMTTNDSLRIIKRHLSSIN